MIEIPTTKDVCPYTVYSVTELKTEFPHLIFWRFLFITPIAPNKIYTKIKTSTVFCFTGAVGWSNNCIQYRNSFCIVFILILQKIIT